MSEMAAADGDDWVGREGGSMSCVSSCCQDCCPEVVPVTITENHFDFGTDYIFHEWSGNGDGSLDYTTDEIFLQIFSVSVGGITQPDDVYSIDGVTNEILFSGEAPVAADLIVVRGLIAAP
jgi:hypothetical protein